MTKNVLVPFQIYVSAAVLKYPTRWPDGFHDASLWCSVEFSVTHIVALETAPNKMCHLLAK